MSVLITIGFSMICIGVALIVLSLILTVVWKVPSLIDELTGRKAKRQIERMRKLNIASSSIGMDTDEFYKSMRDDDSVLKRNPKSVDSNTKLSKLVDDPYGTIGTKNRPVVVSEVKESDVKEVLSEDDVATDMFDDSLDSKKRVFNIKIVEEQTSLKLLGG